MKFRMALADADPVSPTADALISALVLRQEQAWEWVTPETNERAFNAIVSRSNHLREELSRGEVNARLELEVGEVLMAWDHLREHNELPPDFGPKFPWLVVGIGAVVVGGIWWWAWGERKDRMLEATTSDCGCGG
jgi:hypothetical protein